MNDLAHAFDETLLSGFVDGELTQAERQRVRIHLESCSECRNTAESVLQIREATKGPTFRVPIDTQWDETPVNGLSRWLHTSGWIVAALWVVGLVGYVGWQIVTDNASVRLENLLGFGLILAFALITLSALVDRLKTRKNDPYRKVQK